MDAVRIRLACDRGMASRARHRGHLRSRLAAIKFLSKLRECAGCTQ